MACVGGRSGSGYWGRNTELYNQTTYELYSIKVLSTMMANFMSQLDGATGCLMFG